MLLDKDDVCSSIANAGKVCGTFASAGQRTLKKTRTEPRQLRVCQKKLNPLHRATSNNPSMQVRKVL
jgi:hypothetical protein